MRLRSQTGFKLPPTRTLGKTIESLHFPHRCALWMPSGLEAQRTPEDMAGLQQADPHHVFSASPVPCYYSAAPETDQPTVMGRAPSNNILTLDVFLFPAGVAIEDQWAICLLSKGDNQGKLFMAQGAPESLQPGPHCLVGYQRVLCMRVPTNPDLLPPGVDLTRIRADLEL